MPRAGDELADPRARRARRAPRPTRNANRSTRCISSPPGWHISSTVRPDGKTREHGREIGLVEPAAEVEAYEIVAAPQAFQRRRGAEESAAPSARRRAARAADCRSM